MTKSKLSIFLSNFLPIFSFLTLSFFVTLPQVRMKIVKKAPSKALLMLKDKRFFIYLENFLVFKNESAWFLSDYH